MKTKKYTGKGKLVKRLAIQVGSKTKAIEILRDRGHLKADGETLTRRGEKRNDMTARQRAIDRASRKSGRDAAEYKYNSGTNSATLKKKR